MNVDQIPQQPKNIEKQEQMEAKKYLDFRGRDLREFSLDNFTTEILQTCEFDTETKWPDKLPDGFKPEKILEDGKNPGLGVRELHKEGITGKGINIAIIDQKLLTDHVEYKDNLVYYEENNNIGGEPESMHGGAVSSMLVGKECGVSPESRLHYFAVPSGGNIVDYENALKKIIEKNQTLSQKDKIRVVSVSFALGTNIKFSAEEKERIKKLIKDLESKNITIVSPGFAKEESNFEFLGTGNPDEDKDNTDKYELWSSLKQRGVKMSETAKEESVLVPCDYRTMASYKGEGEYQYGGAGGLSWSVPYLAGVFALALQVNPELTKKEILEKIKQTAVKNKEGFKIINPIGLVESIKSEKEKA